MTQPPLDGTGSRSTRARTWFPVAQLHARGGSAHQGGASLVHALDGDGTPFCGRVPADELRPMADTGWYDVEATRRCGGCRIAMLSIGADDL